MSFPNTRGYASVITLLLHSIALCSAVSFDMVGRSRVSHWSNGTHTGELSVRSRQDTAYFVNVTLGGENIELLLDTGSADLWTNISIPNAHNLSAPAVNLSYAVGQASGYVYSASIEFGGFHVSDQAFLQVTQQAQFPAAGVFGVGPYFESKIWKTLNASGNTANAEPPLNRLFQQDPSIPNYFTVFLIRTSDDVLGQDSFDRKGQFTIGSVIDGFEDIHNQPKFPILAIDSIAINWWSTWVDAVTGPDGESIPLTSNVNGSIGEPRGRGILDTGYALPTMPQNVVDAIYGRVPGATLYFDQTGTQGTWAIPCDYELNVSFVIHGMSIPISPLDISIMLPGIGNNTCIGTFTGVTDTYTNQFAGFDIVLGEPFLRNVYTLINFGNFTSVETTIKDDPYFQLLPVTDMKDAHDDFVKIRRGGNFSYVQPPLVAPGLAPTTTLSEPLPTSTGA